MLTLEIVWDGAGKNDNAGLTVLRHFDSASVVKGFVGGAPKTAWIVDYPMFERIHYLLVAGFDVFGNVGHQIMTRLYMDFLRMEGEANYLLLLPKTRRRALAESWYRGLDGDRKQRVLDELAGLTTEPNVKYKTATPELELNVLLEKRLSSLLERDYTIPDSDPEGKHLRALDAMRGGPATAMPELAFVALEGKLGDVRFFTVMRDSAHTNVVELFEEEDRRVYAEDELRVVPGFIGAYPNALFKVRETELELFIKSVAALRSNSDYRKLRERFGVLRHSPDFWTFSDRMHTAYRASRPLEAGVFDYNRLQAP